MISKPENSTSTSVVLLLVVVLAALFGPTYSDAEKDKAECADKVVGILTCLPYVAGDEKTPALDCCTGLKTVIDKSKRCLCLIIKDRDDPSLGLNINLKLALSLPDACHTPTNITECVDLLQLDPNSPDAKAFEGSARNTSTSAHAPSAAPAPKGIAAPPTAVPTPSTDSKSSGQDKLRTSWGVKIACAAAGLVFATLHTAFEY